MSDAYSGQVSIVSFEFAPKGWAKCDGALLPVAQNPNLFFLLGKTYGGNRQTTFGLPNLQGSAPVYAGQGNGLSAYILGQAGGQTTVKLTTEQMPTHRHVLGGILDFPANLAAPSPEAGLANSSQGSAWLSPPSDMVNMSDKIVQENGGNAPHNNMMPYLVLNFCILLDGIFPG